MGCRRFRLPSNWNTYGDCPAGSSICHLVNVVLADVVGCQSIYTIHPEVDDPGNMDTDKAVGILFQFFKYDRDHFQYMAIISVHSGAWQCRIDHQGLLSYSISFLPWCWLYKENSTIRFSIFADYKCCLKSNFRINTFLNHYIGGRHLLSAPPPELHMGATEAPQPSSFEYKRSYVPHTDKRAFCVSKQTCKLVNSVPGFVYMNRRQCVALLQFAPNSSHNKINAQNWLWLKWIILLGLIFVILLGLIVL